MLIVRCIIISHITKKKKKAFNKIMAVLLMIVPPNSWIHHICPSLLWNISVSILKDWANLSSLQLHRMACEATVLHNYQQQTITQLHVTADIFLMFHRARKISNWVILPMKNILLKPNLFPVLCCHATV